MKRITQGIIFFLTFILLFSHARGEKAGHNSNNAKQLIFTSKGGDEQNRTGKRANKAALDLNEPVLVKDLVPGEHSSFPELLTEVNNTLFFRAYNDKGYSLWKSDGTEQGTVKLKQFIYVSDLTKVGDTLFFVANWEPDDDFTRGLWKSDVTEEGTVPLKQLDEYMQTYESIDVNGTLFFVEALPPYSSEAQLWKSNGTKEGTMMVKEFEAPYILDLTDVNGTLFFQVRSDNDNDEFWNELWKSDGTEAGTVRIRRFDYIYNLVEMGGLLFFAADFNELRISDGTVNDTHLVKSMKKNIIILGNMINVKGTLFFMVYNTNISNYELWRSNGENAGSVAFKELGTLSSDYGWFTNVNGTLFFTERFEDISTTLWKSDGTGDGTVIVSDKFFSSIDSLSHIKGNLFFAADDGEHGSELWRSNGTDDGTVMVADSYPSSGNSSPYGMTYVNGSIFFTANDGVHGTELWKIDAEPIIKKGLIKNSEERKDKFSIKMECEAFDNVTPDTAEITVGPFHTELPITDFMKKGKKLVYKRKDENGFEKFILKPAKGNVIFTAKKHFISDGVTNPITVGIKLGEWECLRVKDWTVKEGNGYVKYKYRKN